MMSLETASAIARGMLEDGRLPDVAAANVEIVRMMGVRLISESIPAEVRKELRAAVKGGRLGHLPKNGLEPEAFFHPNARSVAMDQRAAVARESIDALRKVYARPTLPDLAS